MKTAGQHLVSLGKEGILINEYNVLLLGKRMENYCQIGGPF